MQRIKLWGADEKANKKFNIIISLSISLLTVIPHVTGQYQNFDVIKILNESFPQFALLIIALVMCLILLGLLIGDEATKGGTGFLTITAIGSMIIMLFIFMGAISPGTLPYWLQFITDPGFATVIVMLLAAGLVFWMITKEPSADTTKPSTLKTLKRIFKDNN